MLYLVFIAVFIFSFAITIAAIWIAHQFTTTYGTPFHKHYLYYLFAFFGFALYGIWGQILMRVLLSSFDADQEMIARAANFLPILGIPFLLISWIMLVKMGYSLVDVATKKTTTYFQITFFALAIPLIWGFYFFSENKSWFSKELMVTIGFGFIFFIELINMIVFAFIIFHYLKKYKNPNKKPISRFVGLMLSGLLLRGCILFFYDIDQWVLAPLLLLYFLSNLVPLLYLKLKSDLIFKPIFAERPNAEKKELLFEKYQITKREKEIIDKILLGKTNQQIADELFIGLQTVKDHTHRIYTKIGINSRLKLVQIING